MSDNTSLGKQAPSAPYPVMLLVQDQSVTPPVQHENNDGRSHDLEHKIMKLRRDLPTETFRRFLLSVLKVEYGVDMDFEQRFLTNVTLAQHFRCLMQLHKEPKEDSGGFYVGFMNGVTCFLNDFAEPILDLKLQTEALIPLLARYHYITKNNLQYRSTFSFGDFHVDDIAVKLFYDRVHLIDTLVPKGCPELRSRLHVLREEKQKLYFSNLESAQEYQLSGVGKQFDAINRHARKLGREDSSSCSVQ